jgi:hypothetical protein
VKRTLRLRAYEGAAMKVTELRKEEPSSILAGWGEILLVVASYQIVIFDSDPPPPFAGSSDPIGDMAHAPCSCPSVEMHVAAIG